MEVQVVRPEQDGTVSLGLVGARKTVLTVTANGYASLIDVAHLVGEEANVVIRVEPDCSKVLAVCANGYGKVTNVDQFRIQHRGGKGVFLIDATDRNGPLVALLFVNSLDDVIIYTERGKAQRIAVSDIRECGRATSGVRLMEVAIGDFVSSVVRISDPDDVMSDRGMRF